MSTYSLTNSWLVPLVRAIETYGVDPHDLLMGELKTDDLNDPVNARIDHDSMTRLWRRATALTGDPAIGLVAAGYVGPATFGSLSYAMNASDSPLTALRTLVRFAHVVSNAAKWWIREDGQYVELTQKMLGAIGAPEQKDANAGGVLNICRSLGDPRIRYRKLIIGRPPPRDMSRWESYFSIRPAFQGNGVTVLKFAREDLNKRCPSYEPELFELSISILEKKLKLVHSASFLADVKSRMIECLEQGHVSIDRVADQVGLSRRTLQRKLWEESNVTYSSLFQSVRFSLAKRYLTSTRRSIEEISDLLNYSNVSSFSRSFRQNFGMTPSGYRRTSHDSDESLFDHIGLP